MYLICDRYVDRVAANLNQKLELSQRMEASAIQSREKSEEVQKSQSVAANKVEAMVAATKALKTALEQELSIVFEGRVIHLTGAIHDI